MSFDNNTGHCFCERCGHDWTPKDISAAPRSCARCKSKVWNQPRVYAGKYVSGTLAKRFKPTGRASRAKAVDPELTVWREIANDPQKTPSEKVDAILATLSPEEREATVKKLLIYRMAAMLEELGLK